jgi:hypothetical protein
MAQRNQLARWQAIGLANYQLGVVRTDHVGDIGIS